MQQATLTQYIQQQKKKQINKRTMNDKGLIIKLAISSKEPLCNDKTQQKCIARHAGISMDIRKASSRVTTSICYLHGSPSGIMAAIESIAYSLILHDEHLYQLGFMVTDNIKLDVLKRFLTLLLSNKALCGVTCRVSTMNDDDEIICVKLYGFRSALVLCAHYVFGFICMGKNWRHGGKVIITTNLPWIIKSRSFSSNHRVIQKWAENDIQVGIKQDFDMKLIPAYFTKIGYSDGNKEMITIYGTKDEVLGILETITKTLSEFTLYLPSSIVGFLVGYRGDKIKLIQSKTNCVLTIEGRSRAIWDSRSGVALQQIKIHAVDSLQPTVSFAIKDIFENITQIRSLR